MALEPGNAPCANTVRDFPPESADKSNSHSSGRVRIPLEPAGHQVQIKERREGRRRQENGSQAAITATRTLKQCLQSLTKTRKNKNHLFSHSDKYF